MDLYRGSDYNKNMDGFILYYFILGLLHLEGKLYLGLGCADREKKFYWDHTYGGTLLIV